ncbi:hypothetical protein [Eubacterium pyruvativorans]|uniref:hypothetical protein n=1 Tax=Eubacterium pyruvativorans TaxID=155865 RepID=UPI0013D659D5|nr:hypothetical protein [Eubacterium pyruvativorans]
MKNKTKGLLTYEEDGNIYYYHDEEDFGWWWEMDDDDMGDGCAACGNPAYPECMSSCPMYDD